MKKLLFFISITMSFLSCNSKKDNSDIIKSEAERLIKENMNDVNSYEFVEFKKVDSVTYGDNINFQKVYYKDQIDSYRRLYEISNNDDHYLKEINNFDRISKGLDSLSLVLKDSLNTIASYTYTIKFRGNNALGAKVLNEYIIQTDKKGTKIINFTDNKDKVLLSPNYFPGFIELRD